VLETNLTPPRVRAEHIPRERLLAALGNLPGPRLTLVAAPPGFGKSTFLAEWAAAHEGDVAWLSLDEHDNDPGRFVASVVAALGRLQTGVGDRALATLRSPGADLIGVVLPLLLNDVAELARDVALVIEDYYLITNSDVHQALAYVVERSPARLRIVLSTRHDPALPLGRLRARGELTEVRADDLRFTDEEARQFLTGPLGLRLSDDDLARLQARTEGWPAALYLAALTLRGQADPSSIIERFAGDDRYIVDYLTTEVLARQTPALRSFLLRTSILARFCGPLCDAVTGGEDSADRLAELERSNLLLVALDTRREWYRYHHLFGDLLRHELEATDRASLVELHSRASAWYRAAGLIVDAATHAIAAGEITAVAELVGRYYALFVDAGQLATVVGWLEAVPESAIAKDWMLGFAGSVVYAHAGRLDDAERWLGLAEAGPQVARDGQQRSFALATGAAILRLLRGDIAGTVANARRALAGVPEDAEWAFGPRMVLASGLWWSGQIAEANAVLEAATRVAKRAEIDVDVVYALGVRAAIALEQEDERRASVLADEAMTRLRRAGLEEHTWTSMAQITHGALLGRRGELDAAAEAIEQGLVLGERLRAWQVTVSALLALAEVRQRQHDPTAARRLLTRARDILEPLPDPGDGFDRVERTEKALRLRAPRRARSTPDPFWELSPREIDVLRLLPSAMSQREIAAEMYVSFNTIRTHTRVIFSKLGVTSRTEAVARARELGLI
ncbi:MAG TPA: LuxR C-terminal-related transcriptional regulator, partial [Candidatus Limnocylindrales bacterium]|nr:LuxR C-terminal-related transcriptional regulator [Candidatus Limnocylindrales bacterium]